MSQHQYNVNVEKTTDAIAPILVEGGLILKLIIYDGQCLLCHSFVGFINKRDMKKVFTIRSNEDTFAKNKIEKYGLKEDSVFYIREEEVFVYSQAVLEIMKDLGGLYSFVYVFKILPRSFRDGVYKFIAKHRHRFFAKKDACSLEK